MDYETEEQQIDAIKEWWKHNGNSVLLGLGIGVAIIVSWNVWKSRNITIAFEASDHYEQVIQAMETGDEKLVASISQTLRSEYSDSSFAAMASLVDAKVYIENSEFSQANTALQWVIDNSNLEEVQIVAKIRKARILLHLDKTDEALSVLPVNAPQGFVGLVEEVRGDIYIKNNDSEKARLAYQAAKASPGGGANSNFLEMKLNDIQKASPVSDGVNKDES